MENTDKDLVTELAKQVAESIKTYPGRDPNQPINEKDLVPIITIVVSGILLVPLEEIAAGRYRNALLSITAMAYDLEKSIDKLDESPSRN